MSTPRELNNWIEQQINSKKQNAINNQQSLDHHVNNSKQIALLEQENELLMSSIKSRKEQDSIIDESIKQLKKMVRDGAYGDDLKDMKFIDE
jgi:glutamate mutase epsilon subunit